MSNQNNSPAVQNQNAKPPVEQREQRQLNPAQKAKSIMDKMMPQIKKALPKYITPDRLARIILTEVSNNPKLMQCTTESFLGAVMQSAELGLAPGTLGHCYFIPFNNSTNVGGKWEKQLEVQFMIGYKGYLELFRRSGEVTKAIAKPVFTNDEFEYTEGTDGGLRHRPKMHGDRGEVYAYYFYAKFANGEDFAYVMTKKEVEKHREATKKGNHKSPWDTDFDAMACKTCVRLGAKYMPISAELMHKVSQDETIRRGTEFDGISTDQYINTEAPPERQSMDIEIPDAEYEEQEGPQPNGNNGTVNMDNWEDEEIAK